MDIISLVLGKNFTKSEVEKAKGKDGFSPIATVTKEGNITTITITDVNGTTTAQIVDSGVDLFSNGIRLASPPEPIYGVGTLN